MKTQSNALKVALFLCLSLAFNLSYKTAQAQIKEEVASLIYKENKKNASDSALISYIIRYKIKSVTGLTYTSADSTFNKAKLTIKDKAIYDRQGNLVENFSENGNGKIMQKALSKFNSKNNLTEYIVYDSTNKLSSLEKRVYDDINGTVEFTVYDSANKVTSSGKTRYDKAERIIESSSTMPLSTYTYNKEDDSKILTYTYRYKYDSRDNLLESTTDSSGIEVNKTVSKYDDKNQKVYSGNYDHNVLQSTETNVYDKKGAYTQTVEYYWTASKTQCSPNKNRTVTKFDAKGNSISSISTSDENGAVTTTKITSVFKYSNIDKLVSVKTTTETKAEGFSSKAVTSEAYKYDKNGNPIETVTKYGGSGSGTYTSQTEYNSNNQITKQTVYNGTCMDKPSNILVYLYHPDGKTIKEVRYEWFDYPSKSIDRYDERGITTEHITINESGSDRTVYSYEYWQ